MHTGGLNDKLDIQHKLLCNPQNYWTMCSLYGLYSRVDLLDKAVRKLKMRIQFHCTNPSEILQQWMGNPLVKMKTRQMRRLKHCFPWKQIFLLKNNYLCRRIMEKAQKLGGKDVGRNKLHKEVTSLFLILSDLTWFPCGSCSAQSTDCSWGLAGPQDSP